MDTMYLIVGNGNINEPDVILGWGRDIVFIKKAIKYNAAKGIKISLYTQIDVNGFMSNGIES